VKPFLLPLLLALVSVGCNKGLDNKEAVRQGVLEYLAKRANLNVASMNVDVVAVSFRGSEADATVSFHPKDGAGGPGGMEIRYTLEKKGSRWVVKGKGSSHAGAEAAPPSMPGSGMPPGHPSVEQKDASPGAQKK
jgi:hypothetical protein